MKNTSKLRKFIKKCTFSFRNLFYYKPSSYVVWQRQNGWFDVGHANRKRLIGVYSEFDSSNGVKIILTFSRCCCGWRCFCGNSLLTELVKGLNREPCDFELVLIPIISPCHGWSSTYLIDIIKGKRLPDFTHYHSAW